MKFFLAFLCFILSFNLCEAKNKHSPIQNNNEPTYEKPIFKDPYIKWLELSEQDRKLLIINLQDWFGLLSNEKRPLYRSDWLYGLAHEYKRLNEELKKCEDFQCEMKCYAYISCIETWITVVENLGF